MNQAKMEAIIKQGDLTEYMVSHLQNPNPTFLALFYYLHSSQQLYCFYLELLTTTVDFTQLHTTTGRMRKRINGVQTVVTQLDMC